MDGSTTRSKRASLRFTVENYTLSYKTEFEDGTATLLNISAGGCALIDLSVAVKLHEKVLLVLRCEDEVPVEIGGVIVRMVDDLAAVRFTQFGDDMKSKVIIYFAKMQRLQKAG